MNYRIIPGKTRALCTVCGTVRTCAADWRGRNWTGEGASDQEHVDLLAQKGMPGFGERPFERCLGDMKCATCGTVTRHAWLRDHCRDEVARDHAELGDYGRLPSPHANRVWRLPQSILDELR